MIDKAPPFSVEDQSKKAVQPSKDLKALDAKIGKIIRSIDDMSARVAGQDRYANNLISTFSPVLEVLNEWRKSL